MTQKENGFGAVGWLVVVALVAALAGGGYWYWQQHSEKEPEYKTMPVTRGDLIQIVTATGQLNPRTTVEVGSQVSGIIRKIYVDYNSPVTNHQLIAELDPVTYKAIVAQARAELANARAGLELAKANEERSAILFSNKIVAQADQDANLAAYHQAEAQVELKQATLDQAEANLAYTKIYAPVDGIVISRSIDAGQTVAASFSAPTLFLIANDLSKMHIDALVSEADIGGVETNQTVNFTVDAYPTRTFQGTVLQIRNAPQTNQNVITYVTVIGVDNADMKLRPGMTANVSIITAQRNDALKIPNAGLRFHPPESAEDRRKASLAIANASNAAAAQTPMSGSGSGSGHSGASTGGAKRPKAEKTVRTVYMLAKSADGKTETLKPVQIRTGINDGIATQVLEGLNEGDEVVVGQNIVNGAQQSNSSNPFGGGGRRY